MDDTPRDDSKLGEKEEGSELPSDDDESLVKVPDRVDDMEKETSTISFTVATLNVYMPAPQFVSDEKIDGTINLIGDHQPDAIVLQETATAPEPDGYALISHDAGVAILVKNSLASKKLASVDLGCGNPEDENSNETRGDCPFGSWGVRRLNIVEVKKGDGSFCVGGSHFSANGGRNSDGEFQINIAKEALTQACSKGWVLAADTNMLGKANLEDLNIIEAKDAFGGVDKLLSDKWLGTDRQDLQAPFSDHRQGVMASYSFELSKDTRD